MKKYLIKKLRQWITEAIGYDAILVGSEIRMLKADIRCLKNQHNWQSWSATTMGDVAKIQATPEEKRYSYRACRHCFVEMPESRYYFNVKLKEKNAIEYKDLHYKNINEKSN